MGRNIDDLVDQRAADYTSPGERFRESFLSRYPQSQWASYIDEIAVDLSADISIGTTNLDAYNFPVEAGKYYREGMLASAGNHADIEAVLDDTVSNDDLGTVVYQLNRLSYEVERADTGLENVQQAVEAVLEKLLTQETGRDFSTQGHQDTSSIADIVMEVFSRNAVAREADTLVEEFEASLSQGLLARLDEPQMMTPLWAHQRDALQAWQSADYCGYADMATATGKTVLGLAAIALRYGNLHPQDELSTPTHTSSRDRILIVAHSDLILEQWRREFDRHLNIPEERTSGADEINLTWGEIHFCTPQRLRNQSHYHYDLVILDEAHHYATGSNWGELLDHFDNDILALSGSVDDAGTDSEALQERLQNKVGPEIKRYGITDAQADGVIPAFDWEVRYASFEAEDDFVSLSESVAASFEAFRERIEAGEFDTDRRLRTFEDVRRFSHTSVGKELKRSDAAFRELVTGLFSRRTKRWHLSPALDALTDVVANHGNDHVVVLVDSNAQVAEVTERIRNRLPSTTVRAATSEESRATLRDRLDDFNDAEAGGVLVGTGDLLGEGVDIPQANVAVNMATGGVNAQLVQRIGRVLRNPTGDKHAHFYNIVGVAGADAAIPAQDGRRLLEDAAEFCSLGARFNNLPAFATATQLDVDTFDALLQTGVDAITTLIDGRSYEFPEDPAEREHLEALLETVRGHEAATIGTVLAEWSEYSWYESATDEPASAADNPDTVSLTMAVTAPNGTPLPNATITIETSDMGGGETTAVATGKWTLMLPHEADFVTIEVTHPGFHPWKQQLMVDSESSTIEATLEPMETPAGFAFDAPDTDQSGDDCRLKVLMADDTPVADAAVSVAGDDTVQFLQTDESGQAALEPLPTNTSVRVAVRHSDVGVRTGKVPVPKRSTLTVVLSSQC